MLCVNLNLLAVEIKFDAIVMLGLVSSHYSSNLHHASLIMDCKPLINQIPQVRMKHCYRKANKYTDALARMGASSNQEFLLFDCPSVDLFMLLFYDSASMYYERPWSLYIDI